MKRFCFNCSPLGDVSGAGDAEDGADRDRDTLRKGLGCPQALEGIASTILLCSLQPPWAEVPNLPGLHSK